MTPEDQQRLVHLLRSQRWAALATTRDGEPLASWVAFVTEPDFGGVLMHLSKLSLHTRFLLTAPQASLTVSEPDMGEGNPQELARVSIQGNAVQLVRGTPEYAAARERYIKRLPFSEQWFEFADFRLFRLIPHHVRFVPGLGRVFRLSAEDLSNCSGSRGSATV